MAIADRARNVDSYVGFARETVWGEDSIAAYYAPLLSQNLGHARPIIKSNAALGIRYTQQFIQGIIDPNSGGWSAEIWQDEFAPLVAWALGADSVAGASDVATHTISRGATLPSVTVRKGVDVEEHVYPGLKINTFNLNVSGAGAIPTYDVAGFSKAHVNNETVATPSFTTQNAFAGHNVAVYLDAEDTTRASTVTQYFPTSVTMSVNNNIEAPNVPLGNFQIREEPTEGELVITGTLVFDTFDESTNNSATLFDNYKNFTAMALRIAFAGSGTVQNRRNIDCYFPRILFTDGVPNSNGKTGPIPITMNWMAFYSVARATEGQFVFQDQVITAYV